MSVLRNQDMNRKSTFATKRNNSPRTFRNFLGAAIALLLVAMFSPSLHAQGLDPSALVQKQATDTWPTYNGDYSGRRFSRSIKSMPTT